MRQGDRENEYENGNDREMFLLSGSFSTCPCQPGLDQELSRIWEFNPHFPHMKSGWQKPKHLKHHCCFPKFPLVGARGRHCAETQMGCRHSDL